MPRLELIFLNSANGGGCFRWRDEDSTQLQSEPDARPEWRVREGLNFQASSAATGTMPLSDYYIGVVLRAPTRWGESGYRGGLNEQ
jgi:hypothetical protein